MDELLQHQIETAQKLVNAIRRWEHYIAALRKLCTHEVISAEALEALNQGAMAFDAKLYTDEFMPLMGALLVFHLYDTEKGVWKKRSYSNGKPVPLSKWPLN